MIFKNLAKVFNKTSRWVLIFIIVSVVFVFFHRYSSKKIFNFASKESFLKEIKEIGKISFTSGNELNLENNYQVKEKIIKKGDAILIEGVIEGELDQKLAPLIKTKTYNLEINTTDIRFECNENFVEQYPLFLRRFVYFIPSSPLYEGKKWQINSCKGKFICNYNLHLKEKREIVDIICSGNIGEVAVAMQGNLKINNNYNGFSDIFLDISTESSEMTTSWQFSETFKIIK